MMTKVENGDIHVVFATEVNDFQIVMKEKKKKKNNRPKSIFRVQQHAERCCKSAIVILEIARALCIVSGSLLTG